MICGNADLSMLDETTGRYYAAAREVLGRGQSETGSDGVAHFAPGQCTFIYAIEP